MIGAVADTNLIKSQLGLNCFPNRALGQQNFHITLGVALAY